ncbi:methylated-DNA--[protein]-cysteine S-methyltransferase [Paracnuella aquatica]|uniref:methylated-DNA--[protein]-cysteine S-methyltransferase n=1 Tax=Paracnuella aquatica TaxID=2268757 RepID=UPI000DEEE888|nr:methylated-DNA--[protein]-cysteine S-methyltransferase [Paracnuella aquatica]RPD51680.1 methylated-DNA--[protein]-cysteine S-methyltransferase [Paracnuella aquatica]
MSTYTKIIASPLGPLRLGCTDSAITEVVFLNEQPEVEITPSQNHPLLDQCAAQLEDYFSGKTLAFDLPLAQTGTAFQQKVWDLLLQIPFGKTLSYQTLSKQYGDVKAIRAVAAANGKNNIAIIVPCHRVIGSNQSLTGYAGGLMRKQWLLAHEQKFALGVQQLF